MRLGLRIAQEMVAALGGEFVVDASPGRGTNRPRDGAARRAQDMSIRVLIADDHPVVRDGLRFSLERGGRDVVVVGEAADGIEVLELAKICRVDVFILDITMPRLNGLDTARELLKRRRTARIIILSLHDSRAMVEAALQIGALGYLTKETASSNVTEAVCEAYAGHFCLSPEIAHLMVERREQRGRMKGAIEPPPAMTACERRVLQLIAEGARPRRSRPIWAGPWTPSAPTGRT